MTQFTQKKFSVSMGLTDEGRKNWDKAFGKEVEDARRWEESAAPQPVVMVQVPVSYLMELLETQSPSQEIVKQIRNLIKAAMGTAK